MKSSRVNRLTLRKRLGILLAIPIALASACATHAPAAPTQHTLFLVGDSIMKTGFGNGETGPWGWGSEIGAFFDPARIKVDNEGKGGRSSREYIQEGAWGIVLGQIHEGDFMILDFGHNDAKNSQAHPDRTTGDGNGDETKTITSPVTQQPEEIHSYGWYMRQYIKDARAKGATVIVCSAVPRNEWTDGKINRGFKGYAQWAREAAEQGGAQFIDLNMLCADRFDAMGREKAADYYNDVQHTHKNGARLIAGAVAEGIKGLKGCPLADALAAEPATSPQ